MKQGKERNGFFTRALLSWHAADNDRSLPWKSEKDPYKIWLSEIILQQTRAEQGKPYYLKFIDAFPAVADMAAADDEYVYRLWQGLGYYNRCKNMLATARYISNELDGRFPATYEGLLALKGIGPYTAAAIASFAYGAPCAVVDGNVYRVLSRYWGIEEPFDSSQGKMLFREKADELLDSRNSAAYNQAIMDLGATVCKPRQPACDKCPLQKKCIAYLHGLTTILPVRSKKTAVKKRYFHYLVLRTSDAIWLHKRDGGDIWQNLHEPYLIEADGVLTEKQLEQHALYKVLNIGPGGLQYSGRTSQRLTHQYIETNFYVVMIPGPVNIPVANGKWVLIGDMGKVAFPKTLVSFLEKKLYF